MTKKRTRRLAELALTCTLAAAPAGLAFAQDEPAEPPAAARAEEAPKPKKPIPPGFEPVPGATTENVDANKLVIGAYAAFFAGFFGYVLMVARKQGEMAKEMAELAARIRRVEKA